MSRYKTRYYIEAIDGTVHEVTGATPEETRDALNAKMNELGGRGNISEDEPTVTITRRALAALEQKLADQAATIEELRAAGQAVADSKR